MFTALRLVYAPESTFEQAIITWEPLGQIKAPNGEGALARALARFHHVPRHLIAVEHKVH